MNKRLKILFSIPKSIYLNFKIFDFNTAVKLPILVSYNTSIRGLKKGDIFINETITPFMISFNIIEGTAGAMHNTSGKGYLNLNREGKLILNGKANFASGISLRVENGTLVIGKDFNSNKNCFISCSNPEGMEIGNSVILGWNVNIRDSDGHNIFQEGKEKPINSYKKVIIGNNVWLGANVTLLKGVEIPDGCVVGYNSTVTNKFSEKNSIIGGYPAKIIKENIYWEK